MPDTIETGTILGRIAAGKVRRGDRRVALAGEARRIRSEGTRG
jgi:hypothetical protein